ncbi:putative reverse transcriptase, RNA-dependent DNA polymerase [Tanacetum coccineum]
MVPRTVLTKSGLISLNTARPVNTVQSRTTVNNARPMKNVINNAYSTARRPFNKITAANNSNFNKRVNIVNDKNVNAARPNTVVNTATSKVVLSAVKGNKGNAGNPQQDLKDKGVIDSGCSRHMTGNRSYLTDYEEIDGGFVAFEGNSKGGKITGKACDYACKARIETILGKDYILLPLSIQDPPFSSSLKNSPDAGFKPSGENENKDAKDPGNKDNEVSSTEKPRVNQEKDASANSTNTFNTISPTVNTDGIEDNVVDENIVYGCDDDPNMPELEEIVYSDDDEDVGAEADIKNLDTYILVSPILTTRIHKDHPVEQIIRDIYSAPQTRRMTKSVTEQAMFKSTSGIRALKDPSWIEAMQEELLQFKLQQVWTLVDLPNGKKAIGTKWVYRNKKDERGIVIKNKARLMDVKSAFLYGKIEEEVYDCQPPGFEDPYFLDRVYKVEKALYGLYQTPKAWHETLSTYLLDNSFSDVKTASTPMETHKPLLKDADGEDVDEHLYRSMIGSLMYLTSLRPDIMFAVCACARFQVNPKSSHLHAVKRIFRYLKGQPKLGLWYPKDSPFDLVAYTDSDYAGASLDRKSTIGGCQFLGCRLISWQCKKQTVVANSITEAEYIAASNCCGQVLWIQNQLLDYGYNFMQTKIHIDNESTICIVKNPVFHSKTKHIEIRHHFIRDSNEKKLIQMIKIHTDQNVADLLTKAFDVSRFQYLIASIGMLNL